MSLKLNFMAGLANSIWSALIGLVAVPLYLKYLGIEAYGLIGFFVTLQALLSLLDMGLAPTINREVALSSVSGSMREARNLLHTLAAIYWSMAGVIALVIVLLAPLIAGHWLQSKQLSQDTVAHALMLMGLVVACRWPVGLYMGALMGMQRIVLSSTISCIAGTLSSLGAIAVLIFVSPTIEAFFIWQACVGMAYAILIRWIAWTLVGEKNKPSRFSLVDLKRVWRFSAGMSGVAITGAILMQLDKVLLSKLLILEDFGRYVLAGVVSGGLYIFLSPLFNAIYPRMTTLVASGEIENLTYLYKTGTRLFLAVFFPVAIMASVFSEDLLFLWTRNENLATSTAIIASILLLGTALNGVMHFPFALQMAYGLTKLPLLITVTLIVILTPMMIILTLLYGAIGGALAWFSLNISYLFLGTWLTHRKLLKGQALSWLIHSVAIPFGISSAVIVIGWQLTTTKSNHFNNFFWGVFFLFLAILLNFVLMPREFVARLRKWRF